MSGTVCLTFDFDAMSLWLARDMGSPGPLSRGEFGAVALPRILALLESRNLLATFYVPGHTADTYPDLVRTIADSGHELGLHGYCHEPVSTLDATSEREVLVRSMECLASLAGRPPTGNRTPSWDFTEYTVEALCELGIDYDSSLMGHDYLPYLARRGDSWPKGDGYRFGRATDLLEVPVSWTLDDYPALEYLRAPGYVMPGLRRPADVFANWVDDIKYMDREYDDGVCVLTFHPQVIGRGHRMLALEGMLDQLDDINLTYSRVDTVVDAWRAGRHRS